MRDYRRLIVGVSLLPLATTACTANAISGPELTPVPLTQAAPQPQEAVPAPQTMRVILDCFSSASAQSGEPLIIVDGVPWGGSREELLALDIKFIKVLTDAPPATFTSKRPSGVIIVRTRGGVTAPGAASRRRPCAALNRPDR
jgi:hypothetical protein